MAELVEEMGWSTDVVGEVGSARRWEMCEEFYDELLARHLRKQGGN